MLIWQLVIGSVCVYHISVGLRGLVADNYASELWAASVWRTLIAVLVLSWTMGLWS